MRSLPWKHIMLVGGAAGCALLLLNGIKAHIILADSAFEVYVAAVAALFLGVGIWAGRKAWRVDVAQERSGVTSVYTSGSTQHDLSDRELEVLTMMATGRTNQEIAEALFVSPNTIKTHAANIYSKLNVKRRLQAVQRATELGIITQVDDSEHITSQITRSGDA